MWILVQICYITDTQYSPNQASLREIYYKLIICHCYSGKFPASLKGTRRQWILWQQLPFQYPMMEGPELS